VAHEIARHPDESGSGTQECVRHKFIRAASERLVALC
jgi:hypothetical protein